MTALDRNHLVSHNCRNCYQSGPAPLLLATALASVLMFSYVGKAFSASSPAQGASAQLGQTTLAVVNDGSGSGGMGWDSRIRLNQIPHPAGHAGLSAASSPIPRAGAATPAPVDRVTS